MPGMLHELKEYSFVPDSVFAAKRAEIVRLTDQAMAGELAIAEAESFDFAEVRRLGKCRKCRHRCGKWPA